MAKNEAYREAEKKIEEARLSRAIELDLNGIWNNDFLTLTELPESLGQLSQLQSLNLSHNQLTTLPESLGQLSQLQSLDLSENKLTELPESLGQLVNLRVFIISNNQFTFFPQVIISLISLTELYAVGNQIPELPSEISKLSNLQKLFLGGKNISPYFIFTSTGHGNMLSTLPVEILKLNQLNQLELDDNPLHPELAAAYKEGLDAVKQYLRTKAEKQIILNEAKLILIGEGEVGKSCLLSALRDDEWVEGNPTTHGIEIKPIKVIHPVVNTEITMNGWDFGGQRVYRPTHQLFFSAPAVYLVVWKPREGSQQGFVKEWIKLVKHREPNAKILVVATHGGPGQRQPDIDKQELWDLFGHDTVKDFFLVDSKPDKQTGKRYGIDELKDGIALEAHCLPEMGRIVPASWQQAREALKQTAAAYLPLEQVLAICQTYKMSKEDAQFFVRISHRLGHLIHYEHDLILQDIVILKPDWLATAISFVLDDKHARDNHGLVSFARLGQLWDDPTKDEEHRYSSSLHTIFLRLMERFDLSYRVKGLRDEGQQDETSLIAQLVPDVRPQDDLNRRWPALASAGDEQQVQICRIVDAKNGQSATAEGLFYQLIVRLHKFSLGRVKYNESIHWQRGLVLDYEYNGQALLENIGNDVRITVRAPSPVTFLSILTHEVKWLVENFWEGLRCEIVVPCVEPCGKNDPGCGVFEVQKLIAFKRQGMSLFPCFISGCSQLQDIDCLLRNAPAARRTPVEQLLTQGFEQMRSRLDGVREQLNQQDQLEEERFRVLDLNDRRIMSQVDDAYRGLMQSLTDEAKEGPRLFSFQPVTSGFFDLPNWISQKFLIILWCEHSRLPLPALNKKQGDKTRETGVYELELSRDWFVKAVPFLKILTGTLSLVLPVASSAVKLALDDTVYKGIEKQLDLGQKAVESVGKGMEKAKDLLGQKSFDVEHGEAIAAQGAILRQLHVWLKQKDSGFGGLIRVQNKRQEFLWVHPQFEKEY